MVAVLYFSYLAWDAEPGFLKFCWLKDIFESGFSLRYFKDSFALVDILVLVVFFGLVGELLGLTSCEDSSSVVSSVISSSKIINESGGFSEQERIRITVDVAYGTKIDEAKHIMSQIALDSENVCKEPKPVVRFRTFGESGLTLQLLAWIEKPESRGRVIDELSTLIYESFNREKIEIPFPQRTVHIKKIDS